MTVTLTEADAGASWNVPLTAVRLPVSSVPPQELQHHHGQPYDAQQEGHRETPIERLFDTPQNQREQSNDQLSQ